MDYFIGYKAVKDDLKAILNIKLDYEYRPKMWYNMALGEGPL